MSEEEKEAIKCLELDMLDNKQIEIILNLIEKQQKEIEEIKEKYGELFIKYEMKKLLFIRKDHISNKLKEELYIRKDTLNDDYISKDKIKEITELYKNAEKELVTLPNGKYICLSDCSELIEYLEELLEEK